MEESPPDHRMGPVYTVFMHAGAANPINGHARRTMLRHPTEAVVHPGKGCVTVHSPLSIEHAVAVAREHCKVRPPAGPPAINP